MGESGPLSHGERVGVRGRFRLTHTEECELTHYRNPNASRAAS